MSVRLATDPAHRATALVAERVRVRGTVQGVGFRPTVWRIASELGIKGSVINDAQGVLILAVAPADRLDALERRVRAEAPPLAHIQSIERAPVALPDPLPGGFVIGPSQYGAPPTAVAAADAAAPCVAAGAAAPSVAAEIGRASCRERV